MFSENLKKRRLELGMSQWELAQAVGYSSRSSIAKLESGVTAVTVDKLRKLAKVLDVSADELYGESGLEAETVIVPSEKRTIVLIQAGGKSTRNIMNVPNQFITINEKPVIIYVLEAYEKHPAIDEIDVICLYGWEKVLKSYLEKFHITKVKHIITGGETIFESARLGYGRIKNELNPNDIVLLQEATRPMVNVAIISKLLSCFESYGNSVIVKPMNDYVQFKSDEEREIYLGRNDIYGLESPEAYSAATLKEIFAKTKHELKDDGSCCALILYRLGVKIHFCENTSNNIKIVRQEDSYIFKVLHSIYL